MEQKKEKTTSRIQTAMLLRTLLPMLLMGIIIAISAMEIYKSSIKKEIGNSLAAVASSVAGMYDEMYPGNYELVGEQLVSLYKGEKELTGDFTLLDRVKKDTGIDLTLFYQNTRILTTLKDSDGVRRTTTGLNTAVFNSVAKEKQSMYYQVEIDGKDYYACYYPILDNDEELVCIIGAAKPVELIDEEAARCTRPVWYITFAGLLLAGLVCYSYSNGLIGTINKIEKFLGNMKKGELNNEMASSVLKREDELGSTGKAVMEMQNAIRVLVERDPLTSLYNRRYGNAKLRNIQKSSEKNGLPFSICMGDIDFFKKVNDTYGHDAGDVVLKKVAEILRKALAGKGFISRWGGEEFLLVFSRFNAEETSLEIEKIINEIRKTEILYNDLTIKITMSFGVLGGTTTADFGAMLRKVDDRLYYAKTHGRNQYCNYDEDNLPAKEQNSEQKESGEKTSDIAEKDTQNVINENNNDNVQNNINETNEKSNEKEAQNGTQLNKDPDNNVEQKEETTKEEVKTGLNADNEMLTEGYNLANDDKFIQLLLDKMAEKVLNEEDTGK